MVEIKNELKTLVEALAKREGVTHEEEENKDDIQSTVSKTLIRLESFLDSKDVEENSSFGPLLTTPPRQMKKSEIPILEETEADNTMNHQEGNTDADNVDGNNKDDDDTCYTLREAITILAEENEETALRVGCQLLYLYIINLLGKPENQRYRKIFTCNDSFQKVEVLKGAKHVLMAVGFVPMDGGFLEWTPPPTTTTSNNNNNNDPEEEGLAMEKLREAASALGILKSGKKSKELTKKALAVLSSDPTTDDDDAHQTVQENESS